MNSEAEWTPPRCNKCDGILFGGRCRAPCCNNSPDYNRLWREVLRDKKRLLKDKFEGRTVSWKKGYDEGEGVVESVRIHHGQIFYHLENRSKGLKRDQLDSLQVVET